MKRLAILSLSLLLLLVLIPGCAAVKTPPAATTPAATAPAGTVSTSSTTPVNSATVATAPVPFAVTSATAVVDPTNFTGSCPSPFTFTATIVANGPGTVTYIWESLNSSGYYDKSNVQSIIFDAAGTKTATLHWDLKASDSGQHRVHILTPNDLMSVPVYYELNCGGGLLVTGLVVGVDKFPYTGPCPKTINFWGTISTNGPGTVIYRWERSDGSATTPETLTYTAAGSKTVTNTWILGEGTAWQRLHVLPPDEMTSSQVDFTLTCDK